ncbi:bifunctional 4-hydroxy-3-methylbut-2-enyl diphosphate reductase/30S ribosomal protein S1 [Marinisporobacter balticus]|uniref:4-hydroxy-3-methylbut-2-enyl diphosphate reductase n=1 Tax=Marinisporobacter balticus TaxID=2018667 RepID=A0A4R2L3I6_9FIRM|nr:bifunctional 4-hydroxy-3-methylbut-2-enyl diphosphate reductase/30S ribosomal protein S1 [Marinisporobacter balticus]TCO79787.1 4-hydroxy-3-methylbut-2-enyl diphosphate reductase [Marinisporobacter balticus]
MKIVVADNAGFCFGVKQAMNKTLNAIGNNNDKKIYTYGPLIHNNQVIERLESQGVSSVENIQDAKDSTVIIRSHGVPLKIYDLAHGYNIDVIDATCPFVRKVQKIAKEYYDRGYTIVIIGNPKHPEVMGINGWCNHSASIVQGPEDVNDISKFDKICVVAQTTITMDLWTDVIGKLQERANILETFNTICTATKERQTSCADVSKQVDAMIIIGGYHSSNTQKLLQISKKYCKNTYHIETAEEVPIADISGFKKIGVTAGASTPDWIIKEAIKRMDNMEQEQNEMMNMMEEIENSLRAPRRGTSVKGTVILVTDNEIMVNIGYKADGIIPKKEMSNDPLVNPHEIAKEGDPIEAYVLKTDDGEGNLLLSKIRVDAEKNWEHLEKATDENHTLQVRVVQVVKGGVIAVYKGTRGFIPASQLSTNFISDLQEFVDKELAVKIIDLNIEKKKVVFSHKVIMKEENEAKRQKLWENIEKGSIIEGEVKRLVKFGAFVDIGGMDGLIHISDLSWSRVNNPNEVVSIGDKVKVVILDFDKENNRISLGLKQTTLEPWANIESKYSIGDIVKGKVVKLADFGAFVEFEPGVDGLVHISEISEKHISKPSEEVHVGQKVKVKILNLDKENKRISLSMKETAERTDLADLEIVNNDEPTTIGEILASKE